MNQDQADVPPNDDSIRTELIKHLSSEIAAESSFLQVLRSRMAFSIQVGPLLVLGSLVLAATKQTATWPKGHLRWTELIVGSILAVGCYMGFGVYGSKLDEHGSDKCNYWRKTIMSVANRQPLTDMHLDFPQNHNLAYLPGFLLALGIFTGMMAMCVAILTH